MGDARQFEYVMVKWVTMHTHFGSATNGTACFLHILVVGSVWRVGWLHALAMGKKNGNPHVQGIAKAALFQY